MIENKILKQVLIKTTLTLSALMMSNTVLAIDLLDGFGGEAGYGELALNPNDDGSSGSLELPFEINFFGNTYSSLFVNNNGNVTFDNALGNYTPNPFPISNQPMIAPFWADVDTGNQSGLSSGQNNVYIHAPNENSTVITWHDVGYYNDNNSKQNNFQLVLQKAPGTDNGSFSADFRYDRLEWTTGNASGGVNGLGGTPAQAGYDAGDGTNFATLPGSRTSNVLNLTQASNVSEDTPGLWRYLFNNGALPGQTAENALLPVIQDDTFAFEFIPDPTQVMFIDPDVAIGYDYEVTAGSNLFTSVLLPTFADDPDGYQVYALGDTSAAGLLGTVLGGETLTFTNAVDGFTVLGIDTDAMLDPTDPTAFVTGLTFANADTVFMTQTPITTFVAVSNVPEPETYAMMIFGLGLIGFARRKQLQT